MERDVFLGVDGGGTHSTGIAVDGHGRVLAHAKGEGLNYNCIGLDKVRLNLRAVVRELLANCGEKDYARLVVGLSALDERADGYDTRAFAGDIFASDKLTLESDVYIALMGLTLGAPGVMVIAGTGSMVMLLDAQGTQHIRGGWGPELGDALSAHALALSGIRAGIAATEGVGPQTMLTSAVLRFFGVLNMRDLIKQIYGGYDAAALAGFAPAVLQSARVGDTVAKRLVRDEVNRLAMLTIELLKEHPGVKLVGVYGGVFLHNPLVFKAFCAVIARHMPDVSVAFPPYPPQAGAALCALRQAGMWTKDTLATLRQCCEREALNVCD